MSETTITKTMEDMENLRKRVEAEAKAYGWNLDYKPIDMNNIKNMSYDDWKLDRMTGFGGSDEGPLNNCDKHRSLNELIDSKLHVIPEKKTPGDNYTKGKGHEEEKLQKRWFAEINDYKLMVWVDYIVTIPSAPAPEDDFSKFRKVNDNKYTFFTRNKEEAYKVYEQLKEKYPGTHITAQDTDEIKDVREITDEEWKEFGPQGIVCNDDMQSRDPIFPCMIVDIDGLVVLPNGERIGIECKTYSYMLPKAISGTLGDGLARLVKEMYDYQIRHSMRVKNINRFVCISSCGNLENDISVVCVDRDIEMEMALCKNDQEKWDKYVVNGEPVPFTEMNDDQFDNWASIVIDDTVDEEVIELSSESVEKVETLLKLKGKKKELNDAVKKIDKDVNKINAELMDIMGNHIEAKAGDHKVTYIPTISSGEGAFDRTKFKAAFPELHNSFVKEKTIKREIKVK